eukprot:Opistho-2@35971
MSASLLLRTAPVRAVRAIGASCVQSRVALRTYRRGLHPRLYKTIFVNTDGSTFSAYVASDKGVIRLVDDQRNTEPWTEGADATLQEDEFLLAYEAKYGQQKVATDTNATVKAKTLLMARLKSKAKPDTAPKVEQTSAQKKVLQSITLATEGIKAEDKARQKQLAEERAAEEAKLAKPAPAVVDDKAKGKGAPATGKGAPSAKAAAKK